MSISGDESGKRTGDAAGPVVVEPATPTDPAIHLYRLKHLTVSGLTIRGSGQGVMIEDCRDAIVERCSFLGATRGLIVEGTDGARVESCVFARCVISAFLHGAVNTRIAHVTVASSSSLGVLALSCGQGAIRNSLFTGNNTAMVADKLSAPVWSSGCNVIRGASGPWGDVPGTLNSYGWFAACGQERRSVYVVPSFADPAKDDFHIDPAVSWAGGLPGMTVGQALDPKVELDRDGKPFRARAAAVCAGAYDYPDQSLHRDGAQARRQVARWKHRLVKARRIPFAELAVLRHRGNVLAGDQPHRAVLGGGDVGTAEAREGFSEIHAVPPPGKVAVDGGLKDWDLSGAIETFYDESMLPSFSMKLALMYDAGALYIAADFVDDTPMLNAHDPRIEPNNGWAGDCLQVRLCSDPAEAYPLVADTNFQKGSTRICHLTMWFYTPRNEPVLDVRCSMAYTGVKTLIGKEPGLAFRKHADGKGYSLEARIPWELLNAKDNPPKPGDAFTLTAQPLWGSADGKQHKITFNEIVRESGFGYQNTQSWGRAILSRTGNIPPRSAPSASSRRSRRSP